MISSSTTIEVIDRIHKVPRAQWNALLDDTASPFVRHEWLEALEMTGCIKPSLGWMTHHIVMYDRGKLVGAMPTYLKGNSEGEFVYDAAWADAAPTFAVPYFPKWISAVPFTPAAGPRILAAHEHKDQIRQVLIHYFQELVSQTQCSSAHVLFTVPDEQRLLLNQGFDTRIGIQFHWINQGYSTYDDFLSIFNAKRRHQLRRERRDVEKSGIITRTLPGSEVTEEVLDFIFACYGNTVERYKPWTRQYLNREFFARVLEQIPECIEVVVASHGQRMVAAAFNAVNRTRMYGRYWGAIEPYPFLHFQVCYYHSIQECIDRKLSVFEPGAGGEHKLPRGFEATRTHSAHWIRDPTFRRAIQVSLRKESAHWERMIDSPLLQNSAIRADGKDDD